MVEAEGELAEIEVEVAAWNASQRVHPILGVAPERLDPVDEVTPLRATLLIVDDDALAADHQGGVDLSIGGVDQFGRPVLP